MSEELRGERGFTRSQKGARRAGPTRRYAYRPSYGVSVIVTFVILSPPAIALTTF